MAGRVDIWTRFVDFGVDGKGGGVDRFISNDDIAFFVDEDEVGHADEGEVGAERIEPEVVGQDGVADADVTGYAFVEACGQGLVSSYVSGSLKRFGLTGASMACQLMALAARRS